MLDRQINLFKVDTNAFLTDEERSHRTYLVDLKKKREELYKKVSGREKTMSDTINKLKSTSLDKLDSDTLAFLTISDKIATEEKKWKEYILQSSADAVAHNNSHPTDKHIRALDLKYVQYPDGRVNMANVISMFESTLSRSFGIAKDELTYDIFILEIYYYDIAQDLILNGFDFNGKHYVYFSSSAGQIRTKKAVFVQEQKLKSVEKKLMCGLTVQRINELGGMNINKYLAYLALANSATDIWENFDIDRSIVVDDFETMVDCVVDNINHETYEITENVRMEIPIPHTDGCGMILPDLSTKNFMVRLPFVKGLLGVFDFRQFIQKNNCSPVVKDIWGKEYNIIGDNIQVIFTKSQLKMYKYYSSWDEYKEYFKQYGCEAGICNIEENRIPNACINYQMLQTLHDMTDEEIDKLCELPNRKIREVSSSLRNVLDFFGVDNGHRMDWYQKSLQIYPELVTDPAARQDLHDLKNSRIKKYRAGKLDVVGKFTFVLPDLYAFCEWLFANETNPKGLLENGEVYCRLYKNYEELDCLRSPHLYIEHAVRNNVCSKKDYSNWFSTDAIYTSVHDPISRILQFDVDGDKLLVLAQKDLVQIAKRCMQGINPLYYEMKKANAEQINPKNIYNGLTLAFTGGRIGGISNDITKIWNAGNEISKDEKDAVRWLCAETNYTIDYAKTLYKPTRPEFANEIIKQYTKNKTPYFFQYAKDKDEKRVEPINNSTMNKICDKIIENRQMFRPIQNLKNIDYHLMIESDYVNENINKCFDKWNRKYGNNIASFSQDNAYQNNLNIISQEIKRELRDIEKDENKVVDSLVHMFYKKPSQKKKKLFWFVYGEILYNRLLTKLVQTPICMQCGKRTEEDLVDHMCKKCRTKIYRDSGMKKKSCCDCGTDFWVKPNNRRSIRCDNCRLIDHLGKERERAKKNREYAFSVNCEIAKKPMYSTKNPILRI